MQLAEDSVNAQKQTDCKGSQESENQYGGSLECFFFFFCQNSSLLWAPVALYTRDQARLPGKM